MKKNFYLLTLVISIMAVLDSSCNKEETICTSNAIPPLHCIFNYDTKRQPDSVVFYSPGLPDTIYNGSKMPDYLTVPLNPLDDSTWLMMFMRRDSSKITYITKDCVLITYKPQMELINLECGYVYNFNNLNIQFWGRNAIDSIYLLNANVTQQQVNHVQIFF